MTEKTKTVPVALQFDYWNADGDRLPAGSVADLPLAEAKALIDEGKATRADPMPGE